MNKFKFTVYILTAIFLSSAPVIGQNRKSDTNIFGHVVDINGKHIPYATVAVEGTTIGTTTDETGHYQLINLPDGKLRLIAHYLGYKPQQVEIMLKHGETREVKFTLEPDLLGIEEVVVTGDRNETNRTGASTVVNRLTAKLFSTTQSVTLGEGLNFCPGLRLENDCQNCGFTQVRMNGMEGAYSQILINSRAIFSGLAGVYGLELIPSSMIDRVEVIRGGGSALYGSNAIAGTINLILKDPVNNSYEFGMNGGITGVGIDGVTPVPDYSINVNTSLISADSKSGMALYGFNRGRDPFDANGDGFSELSSLRNTTFGTRFYHRFGTRSKVTADFFSINEERRGGNRYDELPHMSDITEGVDHTITTGALTFDQYFRKRDLWTVYLSGQRVSRNSYYGANQSLSDYGKTRDFSYTVGSQYKASFRTSTLVAGIEQVGSVLEDIKQGYPDLDNIIINPDSTLTIPLIGNRAIANQMMSTLGVFAQYEIAISKFKASAGARFDRYRISDLEREGAGKAGSVLSPRVTLKYDLFKTLQVRIGYSQGYRAPQIFDEDLHIETSGARQVIHVNDPDLKQETSHSLTASIDFNRSLGKTMFGLLIEGFYTRLDDAFLSEFGQPDEFGTVVYTRVNSMEGATVQGVNIEMNIVPSSALSFKSGFTIQKSRFEVPHEFNETRFFRTPDDYGYFALDWQPVKNLGLSATGNYTGKMLVPYFGPLAENLELGELKESDRFFDLGMKVRYTIVLNGSSIQLFTGTKNIFNSYQSDFDRGITRDAGYMYGPNAPRTVYIGLKFGTLK
jgi:outer membrane receptor for ferrienterochelin and colicins